MYRVIGGVSAALFPWPRVEGDANVFGHLSVAVPGSVAGLSHALARWGTMEWADALAPAIELAERGYEPDWYQALYTAKFLEELSRYPATARTFLRDGRAIYRPPSLQPGDRVTYPDLARTLRLLARDGPEAFYRGAFADALCAEMAEHGGLITREDLEAYRVREAEPLWGRYRDVDLAFPPGATGGITALEILNILAAFPPERVSWTRPDGLHRRALAIGRAFRDRFEYLGDPEQVPAPWDRLASPAYAHAVARELRGAAPPAVRPAPRAAPEECTTHISVVDRHGNMVALTHTAVSLFGSFVVVPGTGVLLNNGMIWFDPEPGRPNSVAPGKRALVNMAPVLGFRRGRPWLSAGAPGGRAIISAMPQVLANAIDGRGPLQAAVEAPRVHTEGGELLVSDRVGPAALRALARRGWAVVAKQESYSTLNFARPVAIRVTGRGLEAGLEPYATAAAAGP
jgi:gamma-glutamyltranspeptidase/glutathione hydrolase